MERLLDFKLNKIEELSLDELKATAKEKINGKPLHGMYHFDFIQAIMEQLENKELTYDMPVLFAADNKDQRMPGVVTDEDKEEEFGVGNIQTYYLRRLFSQINVTSLEDEHTSTGIGISYNQLGIQVAFGPNVKICMNLSILGGNKFMSTYAHGDRMPSPHRMIEVLSKWLTNFAEERARDLKLMEGMQNQIVPHEDVLEIIGDLTTMRILKENAKLFPKQPIPPLNGSQISKFTLRYMTETAKAEAGRAFSAWELYNFATNLYKPGQTDMPIILSNNYTMSQYLMNRYNLN